MYLKHLRHIAIQTYYVRTTKAIVILVSVKVSSLKEHITLCKSKFAYGFHRNSDMNFCKYYFANATLKNGTTSSNLTFKTVLNNATKAFSRFMSIFSYADFAVLFNNLACLDTSYWIMFFELKNIHYLVNQSSICSEPDSWFSFLSDPFLV